MFILCLEIVFILIKANKRVERINIFRHTYLYSTYTAQTMLLFFLRDKRSITEVINIFATFRSGTNHNKSKFAGIGALKSMKVAVYGMKCTSLCNYTRKLLKPTFHKTRKSKIK